jgi:hypothetical protein
MAQGVRWFANPIPTPVLTGSGSMGSHKTKHLRSDWTTPKEWQDYTEEISHYQQDFNQL